VNACELGGKGGGSGAKRNVSTVSAEPKDKEEGGSSTAATTKAGVGRTRPATAPAKRKLPGDAEPQKRGSRAKM